MVEAICWSSNEQAAGNTCWNCCIYRRHKERQTNTSRACSLFERIQTAIQGDIYGPSWLPSNVLFWQFYGPIRYTLLGDNAPVSVSFKSFMFSNDFKSPLRVMTCWLVLIVFNCYWGNSTVNLAQITGDSLHSAIC